MSEAPKKIWASDMGRWFETENSYDTKYIRADIVEEMREALELAAFHMHKITTSRGKADYSVVRAALKRLEEE